ncbi:hypothetical protein [uncultured Methylobacterium sp.]|uniref:hypothetical protein n=1 Tax=uncultured Methylobacterium sp. TaxID=157278 RepID=UPI0025997567|nr:hypothetical protein [uncultured Methylobacterium sp.]
MNARAPTTPTVSFSLVDHPDDEIAALLQDLIDACPPATEPELSEVALASARVGESAALLRCLLDRAAGGANIANEICVAKVRLDHDRARLAGLVDIEQIGSLDGRPYALAPAWGCFKVDVYRGVEDEPAFRIPHGLGRTAVLAALDAHDAGYDAGHRAGGNYVRSQLNDILRLR